MLRTTLDYLELSGISLGAQIGAQIGAQFPELAEGRKRNLSASQGRAERDGSDGVKHLPQK
jgi:hypothetical protein